MQLSNDLIQLGEHRFSELKLNLSLTPKELTQLKQIIALSDFVFDNIKQYPNWLEAIIPALEQKQRHKQFAALLAERLNSVVDEAVLKREIRLFRRRESVIIAWRDFLSLVPVEESLEQISELAETIIIKTYQWLYKVQSAVSGGPTDSVGNPIPMLIIGMGKLGGKELNFSSDVDLIFAYPFKGEFSNGRKTIEFQQYFTRLAQKLIIALDQQTVDGFAYRIDMRLRPFGESGPLVVHFDALDDYYQTQGREWERFAMVKARILGEQNRYADQLTKLLRPFVFRRYLDFSAIESLRKMKQMISQEVKRRGLEDNIKLGVGGIREIEFVAQTFQLIRGGREPKLQHKSLLMTLKMIQQLKLLASDDVTKLTNAYLFLRRLEHLLQQIADKQTQTLPDNDQDKQRICSAMECADYQQLMIELKKQTGAVHRLFKSVIEDDQEKNQSPFDGILESDNGADSTIQFLEQSTQQADICYQQVEEFKQSLAKKSIGGRGRDILDKLFPEVLSLIFNYEQASELLKRVLHLLGRIVRRTTYLELLWESNHARQMLVKLCNASPWVAEYLAAYPILLDELLDPNLLYSITQLKDYSPHLQQFLLRIPDDDLDMQMEALRQFKQIHQLRIAAADISEVLPLMRVSDHLTALAESVVQYVMNMAWQQTTRKYGFPNTEAAGQADFCVVAYGKMGGYELGYGSDLDLVFLYGGDSKAETDGAKPISTRQFYVKMAQRMLHIFSTRTAGGQLYDVDLRLRPSGDSGVLASHIDSYKSYLLEDAWIWEHQALVRARLVCATDSLTEQFEKVRHEVLTGSRDQVVLREEVVNMRKKMRDHLDKTNAESFDLKQGEGGITDIEFITQYFVLANAQQYPQVTEWSDNIRILNSLASIGIISAEQEKVMIEAYQTLRGRTHQSALANRENRIAINELQEARKNVESIWKQVFV